MDVVINNISYSSGTTTNFLSSAIITLKNNVSQNSNNFEQFRQYFSWYDYILFSAMLAASAAIGLYYGCYGNRNKSTEEYLMGRKSMDLWPLTISLIAGHTSGMIMIGLPADVYMFGATFGLSFIAHVLGAALIAYVIIPVFFKLQIPSTYEYLERRFDKRCRNYASALFTIHVMLHMPIVVYTPALAFQTVTGTNIHLTTSVICGVCIFYTALGGFRAIVWADTLQFVVTMVSVITLLILGVHGSGGIINVWNISREKGRLDISFSPALTDRETFWGVVIAFAILNFGFGTDHSCMQKLLAVRTYKDSVKALFGFAIGLGLRNIIIVFMSLAMFARYSDCDLLSTNQVHKKDQLMPFFVTDISKKIPGLGGLFIAGIFCGELSCLSSDVNALVCSVYEDFLKSWLNKKNDPRLTYAALKLLGVAIGVIVFLEVFIIEKLGGIFSLALTFMAVSFGSLLVLFVLGTMFPMANEKGAFYGSIIAFAIGIFMAAGNKYYTFMGIQIYPTKPVSVENCPFPTNATMLHNFNATLNDNDIFKPFLLFRISSYWYPLILSSIGIVYGLVISYYTGNNDPPIDKDLLSPIVHKWYFKSSLELIEMAAMLEHEKSDEHVKETTSSKLEGLVD